jgi:alginate O-acetyltransferase complex protein AlgJ
MDTVTVSSTQSKSLLRYLPAGFMLLFLAGGLVMSFFSPSLFKSPEKPLLNGQWAAAYEAEFNKSLAIRQPSIDGWGVLEYTLFKSGRDGVLVGDDGWLFTSEEFTFHPDDAGLKEKLELAQQAKETFAQQGINFVVILVPSKARIYSDKLGRYTFPSYNQNDYEAFVGELNTLGIPVVNLLEAFTAARANEEVFLKTDTHWTTYGARLAALELAKVVGEKNLLPSLASTTFTTTPADAATRHEGDLLNYLPLGFFQERLGPAFDDITEQTTEQTSENSGGGLFGSSSIPVTLVGTSYSANLLWNFEGSLKEALGADVLNFANEGEGPVVPMRDYLASDALKDAPPELVIWEIPERFLQVDYE